MMMKQPSVSAHAVGQRCDAEGRTEQETGNFGGALALGDLGSVWLCSMDLGS